MENIYSNIETALHLLEQIKIYLNSQRDIINQRNQERFIEFEKNRKAESFNNQIINIIERNIIYLLRNHLIERGLHREMEILFDHTKKVKFNQWEDLVSQRLSLKCNFLAAMIRNISGLLENQKIRREMEASEGIILDSNGRIQKFGWTWLIRNNNEALSLIEDIELILNEVKEKITTL